MKNCQKCAAKKSIVHDEQTGEYICSKCGCVVGNGYNNNDDDGVDNISRKVTYADNNSSSKDNPASNTPIMSNATSALSVTINKHHIKRDARGAATTGLIRGIVHRTERRRGTNSAQTKAVRVTQEIGKMTGVLNIPSAVKERTLYIFKKLQPLHTFNAKTPSEIAAGLLYVACREHNIPHSLDDFVSNGLLNSVRRKRLAATVRKIMSAAAASPSTANIKLAAMQMPDYPKLIYKIARANNNNQQGSKTKHLDLSENVLRFALELTDRLLEKGGNILFVGKRPHVVAAAILYTACVYSDLDITQSDIAARANVTEVAMRVRYAEYVKLLDL